MTLMMKLMVKFGHSQNRDLVRAKAMGVELPIVLIALSLGLGLFVMVGLIPGTMALVQCLDTSHHSTAVGSLAVHVDWS